MADKPESVTRAENFFDLLALADSYASGKSVPGMDQFLTKAVKGKDQVSSDRISRRPSKRISDTIRAHVERAQSVLDAYEDNSRKPEEDRVVIMAGAITPELAKQVDGVSVREEPCVAKKAGTESNLKVIVEHREHGRGRDSINGNPLPGNVHSEMKKLVGGESQFKDASLSPEEQSELSGLYL